MRSIIEAAYAGNLGFEEMFRFMQKASASDKKKMDKFLDSKKWKDAWELLKRVTGVKLKDPAWAREGAMDLQRVNELLSEAKAQIERKPDEYYWALDRAMKASERVDKKKCRKLVDMAWKEVEKGDYKKSLKHSGDAEMCQWGAGKYEKTHKGLKRLKAKYGRKHIGSRKSLRMRRVR